MGIKLDHTVVYAKDHDTSAREFAEVMGLPHGRISGEGYDFTMVHVNSDLSIYFMERDHISLEQHMAFTVDGRTFNKIVKRLEKLKLPYGGSPYDSKNGQTNHDFAPRGLFFKNVDRCLFEVMTYSI